MEDAKTKFYRLNPEKREEFPAVDFARSRTCRLIERENAALRHTEENLVATVRGLEFELEKAQKTVVALREAALALISELDVEAFDRVGRPKGEMLYEHVGPLRAAVNAARAGEEVRRE
jgi:hypothetical protein